MINFIYPQDSSTQFLSTIISNFDSSCGHKLCKQFLVEDTPESYQRVIDWVINECSETDFIIFLGHGTSEKLYGVYETNEDALIEVNKMSIFDGKHMLALACNSTSLLKNSYSRTVIKSSVGFGELPTDKKEIAQTKYKKIGVTEDDLDIFKRVIVDSISDSLIEMVNQEQNLYFLFHHLKLLLNKEISNQIFIHGNRVVSDLIFIMANEMNYLEK